ncbi:MAG: putative intracellular protease/amidase [Planctomycetota bacterium]|jgi:putative intracellular protease/amidase
MKILMVLTSHDQLGDTDKKTGFWLEEFAAPFYVFSDAGAEITIASPLGGHPPIDPGSDAEHSQTEDTRRFKADDGAKAQLAATVKLSGIDAGNYDAVFYPGGHGPLWDLTNDQDSKNLIEAFASNDRPIGAVCHASGVLRDVLGKDGKPLVSGRRVTGFSNSEEAAAGLTAIVPYLVEDALAAKGGIYEKGDDWAPLAIRDGNLVTGQNPASSAQAAKEVLALMA